VKERRRAVGQMQTGLLKEQEDWRPQLDPHEKARGAGDLAKYRRNAKNPAANHESMTPRPCCHERRNSHHVEHDKSQEK